MKKLVSVMILASGLAMGSFAMADESAPVNVPVATASSAPSAEANVPSGARGHWRHGKNNVVGKAMRQAFQSCKAAGLDRKACASQLATYLADFKPNK